MRNAVVAQSGGPSPVINASLQGVLDACRQYHAVDRVFAARNGILGILQEELFDTTGIADEERLLLRSTPSAGVIGSCRYKLHSHQEEDMHRIIDVFKAHDIKYFFYIGGNDSMDTADKVARLAQQRGVELIVTGIPKTIDNDVGDPEFRLIDHTPGYGSAARYWAYITQILDEENRSMYTSERVCVIQAMGRKAGFIPAAARLADPNREMPLQIYLAESNQTLESLTENVFDQLKKEGRSIVIVSEGFPVGDLGTAHDAFGHIEYGASKTTVAQKVVNHLNEAGFPVQGYATGQIPGVLQRSNSIFVSAVDVEEAYQLGCKAVEIGASGESGYMATILRKDRTAGYEVFYDKVPLESIANSERLVPAQWIAPNNIDVTDEFIRYARPLIGNEWPAVPLVGGIQRFAKWNPEQLEKKLHAYLPENYRR